MIIKYTRHSDLIQKTLSDIGNVYPQVINIVKDIDVHSGRALLVGGAVRDMFLGLSVKDYDIEVYGLTINQLQNILKKYGHVRLVGKSFGVLKIDGLAIDWSLPRTDAAGRKPEVFIDPYMSVRDALLRRDLTINAMAIDCISGDLEDPFNGLKDLQDGCLRVSDAALFVEDPLRYFRVMQFIARFCMKPDQQLYEIGKTMLLDDISHDRIIQEFYKLAVQGKKPSWGIQWLYDTGRLKTILPEIHALVGLEQDAIWHPEGDVFEHSKQAMDSAALITTYSSNKDRLIMVFASLCHDVGKVVATQHVDGRIRSFGHDVKGVNIASELLDRMTDCMHVKETILKLIRYHMTPVALIKNNAGAAAYKRLASKLAPNTYNAQLAQLACCDKSGRNPDKGSPLLQCPEPLLNNFIEQAQTHGVLYAPEEPLLQGRDFLDVVRPGKLIGLLVDQAYDMQIEKNISDKEHLKTMVLDRVKELI